MVGLGLGGRGPVRRRVRRLRGPAAGARRRSAGDARARGRRPPAGEGRGAGDARRGGDRRSRGADRRTPTGRRTATSCDRWRAVSTRRPTWWRSRPTRPTWSRCSTGRPTRTWPSSPTAGGARSSAGWSARARATRACWRWTSPASTGCWRSTGPAGRRASRPASSVPRWRTSSAPTGWTLRHFPQSFEFSSLGGWLATRAGGHYATLHTHIDDFVESLRVVTPVGVSESWRLPGSGAGPSPDRMFLGSEGTLGVITEAWMRVQERPEHRRSTTVDLR